ncbi:hypothetical protein EW146_g7761 [Bondarzewia mesenterica]|uniref:Uncharacterized protein n=1 Tax=Bondarzewia mesenterica TaxID=1095465 RepID=A0A4S4LKA3_9AGAM|nr:hypothetical protein EW146_g7761 [Bondarzewia mesenterica]
MVENSITLNSTTLLESRMTIESGTTGLRTWRASFVLAKYLILHPGTMSSCLPVSFPLISLNSELVTNKRILELGSGTGFLGIIAASLQVIYDRVDKQSALWLTDVHDTILKRCSDNVVLPCSTHNPLLTKTMAIKVSFPDLSSKHDNIRIQTLDWLDAFNEHSASTLQHCLQDMNLDVVIGADLVYHPDIIPTLAAVLKLALITGVIPVRLSFVMTQPDQYELVAHAIRGPTQKGHVILDIGSRGCLGYKSPRIHIVFQKLIDILHLSEGWKIEQLVQTSRDTDASHRFVWSWENCLELSHIAVADAGRMHIHYIGRTCGQELVLAFSNAAQPIQPRLFVVFAALAKGALAAPQGADGIMTSITPTQSPPTIPPTTPVVLPTTTTTTTPKTTKTPVVTTTTTTTTTVKKPTTTPSPTTTTTTTPSPTSTCPPVTPMPMTLPLFLDGIYDNKAGSLDSVACSNGEHGLDTRFRKFGDIPVFPFIGGAFAVTGWNSVNCGTCWSLTNPDTGITINYLAIDTVAVGFNGAIAAMDKLTNGRAAELGRINVSAFQLPASACGL